MVRWEAIFSIIASVVSVAVILFALAKWGARIENSIKELKENSHTHRRFHIGPLTTLLTAILILFKG